MFEKVTVRQQTELAELKHFTFAVVEELLGEDRYVEHSSVLPFTLLLLIRDRKGIS